MNRMLLPLPAAHRIARVNYPPRAISFAYLYVIVYLLIAGRGTSPWGHAFAILQFFIYPHLAYLHTRLARDSKRAELTNLYVDAILLGAWVAQLHFPLLPSFGMLLGASLNNASHGGFPRLAVGTVLFAAGALGWGALTGFAFQPDAGALVTGLSLGGIVMYSSWIGILVYDQIGRNRRMRKALTSSEEQFRFISEHGGDLVSVLDADGRFSYASPSHRRYLQAEAFAPGQEWVALVHPDDRADARQFLGILAASRVSQSVNLRMFPSNDDWCVVECQGNPVRDLDGTATMLVLVSRDVTARLRADIDAQLAAHRGPKRQGPAPIAPPPA